MTYPIARRSAYARGHEVEGMVQRQKLYQVKCGDPLHYPLQIPLLVVLQPSAKGAVNTCEAEKTSY